MFSLITFDGLVVINYVTHAFRISKSSDFKNIGLPIENNNRFNLLVINNKVFTTV